MSLDKTRDKMVAKLISLGNMDGITVTASDENKTVYVQFKTFRSLDFKFVWSNDHFIGYSITKKMQRPGRAVLSLWSLFEATQFVKAYNIMVSLRAFRK